MTRTSPYDDLLARHQALQTASDTTPAEQVAPVRRLMADIVAAGALIRDARQRESLRSVLRYWGAWVYDQTGEYPPSQLAPAAPDVAGPPPRFLSPPALAVGGLVIAGAAILLAVWLSGGAGVGPASGLTPTPVLTEVAPTGGAGPTAPLGPTESAALTQPAPPSATFTPPPTLTPTPSITPTPSVTPLPTITRTPTAGPTPTPAFAQVLRGHTDAVRALAFSADGALLASGGLDSTVRIWDMGQLAARSSFQADQWIFSLAFSANASRLFVASGLGLQGGGQLAVLDVENNRLALRSGKLFVDNVTSLALDRFGTSLAAGSVGNAVDDPNVFLGLRQPDSLSLSAGFSDNPVFAVAFSPDGRHLIYGGTDRAVYVRDLTTANNRRITVAARDRHAGMVRAVAFHPTDSTLAASAGEDGTLRLWRVGENDLRLLATLQGDAVRLFAIAFSPDGSQLAAAGASLLGSSVVELWDVAAAARGEAVTPFVLDAGSLEVGQVVNNQSALAFRAVAYSPDGRRLVAAGDDAAIFLWTLR